MRRRPALAEDSRRMGRPPKEPDLTTYAGRFAARLRTLREDAGLTVEELRGRLAEKGFEVSRRTLNAWEAGDASPPVETFPLFAPVYGVTVADVLPAE